MKEAEAIDIEEFHVKRKYDASGDPAPRGATRAARRRFGRDIELTLVEQYEEFAFRFANL